MAYPFSIPPKTEEYLALVTSEHNQAPKFMAKVAQEVQPYVDLMATLYSLIGAFTPNATGDQLDAVGEWAGVSRDLSTPLLDVFFTLDSGPGLDQGTWLTDADDPDTGLTTLPDDSFQILLKLVIAENNWDGTIPGIYSIWNSVMGSSVGLLIGDNQDRTMTVVLTGLVSLVAQALIADGYFNLCPAGVRIAEFGQPSIPGTPVFGLDGENDTVAGLDVGCWIEPI